MKRLLTLVCLVTAMPLAGADVLKNIDIFELEVATDPQISPDGEQVAYVRRSMDIMKDRPNGDIWVVNTDGSGHRPLLSGAGSYGSPRWSPDGERLAYVTRVEGRGPQIHVRWMDTGQTAVLSNLREGAGSLSWSPDGSMIAFTMFVPGSTPPLAPPPAKPEGADWAPPVRVFESMPFQVDGQGFVEPGFMHVFVISAEGGTPRQLTSGEFDHDGRLAWHPDGDTIIFSANRQENAERDPLEGELWSVDVDSGAMRQLTDRDGPDFAPTLSPDGKTLAWLGHDDKLMGYENNAVYTMSVDGGEPRRISGEFDRSIDDVQWAGSSRELLVRYDDHGKTHIARLSTGGNLDSLTDDVGGAILGRPYTSGSFSVSGNGRYAYTAGRTDRPADVATGRGSREPRRLTALNEDALGHKTLASVEEITWPSSADGLEIQGWVAYPPGFDATKKYPLILEIHGGPRAAYGPQFSPEIQLFAAAGYVVLYANPRGSTSYGYDFVNEIHHNYPSEDYDDLMSGVDAVIAQGSVDENQLFVTGGSGGGLLTAWIVGKTDRFAAAVSAKPVINWVSHVLTADFSHFFTRYWFEKMPWEDPDTYWAQSPLSLVGNVSTPTALLTGESDVRTPMTESEQFYQALKLRDVDTALIRVPEAYHGIVARPSHLIAKVDNILAWFERYRDMD